MNAFFLKIKNSVSLRLTIGAMALLSLGLIDGPSLIGSVFALNITSSESQEVSKKEAIYLELTDLKDQFRFVKEDSMFQIVDCLFVNADRLEEVICKPDLEHRKERNAHNEQLERILDEVGSAYATTPALANALTNLSEMDLSYTINVIVFEGQEFENMAQWRNNEVKHIQDVSAEIETRFSNLILEMEKQL